VSAPPPGPVIPLFTGNNQIFLTLTATSFPVAQGQETESVEETANGNATVQLTYTYTPVPEPGTVPLLTIGTVALLWFRRAGELERPGSKGSPEASH
jgi:PEP-CTERM motif